MNAGAMNGTHTPGPWRLSSPLGISSVDGLHVCDVVGYGATEKRNLENAALIAAAPELLAALEGLLHGTRRPIDEADWHREREEASAIARAAIAKAKGGA
jgi:hypothetical protein